jgi:hypothetical protein
VLLELREVGDRQPIGRKQRHSGAAHQPRARKQRRAAKPQQRAAEQYQ